MRLIDAEMLKENIPKTNVDIFENCRNCSTLTDWQVKELIDKTPTIDAVSEDHGFWYRPSEWPAKTYKRLCTHCCDVAYFCGDGNYKYCPNCGAKMDGEVKNDEID